MNNRDLISREALLKKYCKEPAHGDCKNCDWFGDSWCRCEIFGVQIAEATAVDAVEAVRCRDCKHWKPSGSKAGNSFSDMEYIGGCEFTNYCRRESDYCSYGERKE